MKFTARYYVFFKNESDGRESMIDFETMFIGTDRPHKGEKMVAPILHGDVIAWTCCEDCRVIDSGMESVRPNANATDKKVVAVLEPNVVVQFEDDDSLTYRDQLVRFRSLLAALEKCPGVCCIDSEELRG